MAKPKKKNGPLKSAPSKIIKAPKVEVSWVDATSHSGWFDIKEMSEKEPVLMHTMGYMVDKNKKYVKLVRSVEDHGDAIGDVFIIPTPWCTKIKRLK